MQADGALGVPEASVIPGKRLATIGAKYPELRLLILFGSRARGDGRDDSDWDLGHLGEAGMDPDALLLDLVDTLDTDRVDLVDLARGERGAARPGSLPGGRARPPLTAPG